MLPEKAPLPNITVAPEESLPNDVLTRAGIMGIFGEINDNTVLPVVAQILEYNYWPEHLAPESIELHLNTPGGDLFSALHLLDVMQQSRIPVNVTGFGLVASAGVILLMSGNKRLVTENTTLMSHQFSTGSFGKEHELLGMVKEYERISSKILGIYQRYTGKTKAYIKRNLLGPTDVWLSPEEAQGHGIIDGVIYGKLRPKDSNR